MDALSAASDAVSDMDLAGASLRVRVHTHIHTHTNTHALSHTHRTQHSTLQPPSNTSTSTIRYITHNYNCMSCHVMSRHVTVAHDQTALISHHHASCFSLLFSTPRHTLHLLHRSPFSLTFLYRTGCRPALGAAAHSGCLLSACGVHHIRLSGIPCLPHGKININIS